MTIETLKIYGALTFVGLLYGINYNVLKIIIPTYVGAYGLILYRVVISAVIFWSFYFFCRERIDWKSDGIRMILCALTGTVINMLFFCKGIGMTSAVNASIIMTLTPVLVLVWASLLMKEKITLLKVFGIIIGMIGALTIFYQPDAMLSSGDWRGDVLILINGILYSCYLVIVKPLMKKYKPITVVTWIFTLAILFVIPVGFSEARHVNFHSFTPKVWLSIGYSIVFVTVIVYFLNVWTLIRVESSIVGAFIYLQPLFATLTAILFFHEVFLLKHAIAACFVFLGVWLVMKKSI